MLDELAALDAVDVEVGLPPGLVLEDDEAALGHHAHRRDVQLRDRRSNVGDEMAQCVRAVGHGRVVLG